MDSSVEIWTALGQSGDAAGKSMLIAMLVGSIEAVLRWKGNLSEEKLNYLAESLNILLPKLFDRLV